jgi:hypothetical protein
MHTVFDVHIWPNPGKEITFLTINFEIKKHEIKLALLLADIICEYTNKELRRLFQSCQSCTINAYAHFLLTWHFNNAMNLETMSWDD